LRVARPSFVRDVPARTSMTYRPPGRNVRCRAFERIRRCTVVPARGAVGGADVGPVADCGLDHATASCDRVTFDISTWPPSSSSNASAIRTAVPNTKATTTMAPTSRGLGPPWMPVR
jgi:hypothetical protein